MMALRIIAGAIAVLIGTAILWAIVQPYSELFREAEVIWAMPWGRVTLIDLYGTFALIALVIFLVETTWWRALLWIVPIPFLGGVWAAIWFVIRMPRIVRLLDPRRGPMTE